MWTVDSVPKQVVHEHNARLYEAGFDRGAFALVQERMVIQRKASLTCVGAQPDEKAMLKSSKACQMGDCSAAPDGVVDYRPNVSVKRTEYGLMVESGSHRDRRHMHSPHKKPEHPVSFRHRGVHVLSKG